MKKTMETQEGHDLTQHDIKWLDGHGFKINDLAACYQRTFGNEKLSIYYSVTFKVIVCVWFGCTSWHGEGKTAEEAFLDFLQKNKSHIEEWQSFQNELEKI